MLTNLGVPMKTTKSKQLLEQAAAAEAELNRIFGRFPARPCGDLELEARGVVGQVRARALLIDVFTTLAGRGAKNETRD